ncbi:MAG: 50S ribosomal protein L13 [Candidatus Aenigmatarchaeota archaeon]
MIIDGKNAVLGRLAANTAKRLLSGEMITLVNADDIIISGNSKNIKEKYFARRARGSPQHGPFFPVNSDRIAYRAVRGMLPYKTLKGRAAVKRLKVFAGMPENLKNNKHETLEKTFIKSRYIKLSELADSIGG